MPWINTADRDRLPLTPHDAHNVYNALDCCLTAEIFHNIAPQLTPVTQHIYDFERSLQAPALDMMLRGVRVNRAVRDTEIERLQRRKDLLQSYLDTLAGVIWGRALNPESSPQLKTFFYDIMQVPPVKKFDRLRKITKISADREALEHIRQVYSFAAPIVTLILAIRDLGGLLEALKRGVDSDGRFRCSYNISGTVTGRWSSSKNLFGSGSNFQNFTGSVRDIFIADPGLKLAYLDLEQAESRTVGLLCQLFVGGGKYLAACGEGDLHTLVTKLVWPELPWTGDPKADRKVADTKFYRDFTYRDLAKRGGHGCLTEDHEVLTPAGWIPIAAKPPIIRQWGGPGLPSDFVRVQRWADFYYSGELYELETSTVSARMTDNHRIPCLSAGGVLEAPAETTPEACIPCGFNGHSRAYVTPADYGSLHVPSRRVFCPTVPSSWFYIRRNGRISVTGNSNYGGTPNVLASHLKIDRRVAATFQANYFEAFQEIPDWHRYVLSELERCAVLITPFGRRRKFFGRLSDSKTLKEAIAYGPQSLVGDMLNSGLRRIYHLRVRENVPVWLLAQVHDAVVIQYPAEAENEIIPMCLTCLEAPLEGHDFSIPSEAQVGWNWGKASTKNPYGLVKWTPTKPDTREGPAGLLRSL